MVQNNTSKTLNKQVNKSNKISSVNSVSDSIRHSLSLIESKSSQENKVKMLTFGHLKVLENSKSLKQKTLYKEVQELLFI